MTCAQLPVVDASVPLTNVGGAFAPRHHRWKTKARDVSTLLDMTNKQSGRKGPSHIGASPHFVVAKMR
jgi:hypothetical protein